MILYTHSLNPKASQMAQDLEIKLSCDHDAIEMAETMIKRFASLLKTDDAEVALTNEVK